MITLLTGVATMYAGVVGAPLYCDTWDTDLAYAETTLPWVAIDVNLYGGWASCGDEILLLGDGWSLLARAWDAGPLSRYYVADFGPSLRIIADVPKHLAPFPGLSSKVTMVNLSRLYAPPVDSGREVW